MLSSVGRLPLERNMGHPPFGEKNMGRLPFGEKS
jgi:hypothetical protein